MKSSVEHSCSFVTDAEDGAECETMAGLADLFSGGLKEPFAVVMRENIHLRTVSG